MIVDDIDEHGEWPIYRSKAEELGLHAVIGIPLLVGVRKLGALNIYQDRVRAWSEHDVEAARILANIATSYVRHASELDEAQRVNEQLQQALDSRRRKACWRANSGSASTPDLLRCAITPATTRRRCAASPKRW